MHVTVCFLTQKLQLFVCSIQAGLSKSLFTNPDRECGFIVGDDH